LLKSSKIVFYLICIFYVNVIAITDIGLLSRILVTWGFSLSWSTVHTMYWHTFK